MAAANARGYLDRRSGAGRHRGWDVCLSRGVTG